MTPDQRNYLSMHRTQGFYTIMQTAVLSLTAIAGFIHFGPAGYSAPLITLVVAACAYGILAGGSALSDMMNLIDDMDDATAQSAYGQGMRARNLGALKIASSVLLGLVGLAEIYALLT